MLGELKWWNAGYHSIQKGIGPRGMKLEHYLARGGTSLIVVCAITDDSQLREECEDEDGDCIYVEELYGFASMRKKITIIMLLMGIGLSVE